MRHWPGLLVAALLAPVGPASAVPARAQATGPRGEVVHRVVWDQYEKQGTHLWSVNPDGSDPRKIFERPRGQVSDITLNRQGSVAAVAPLVLSADRAALVVVDVMGRQPSRNVIADYPEIYFVGGIGWSPNGRKLVFEGAIDQDPKGLQEFLFTVHRDGTGLRRIASMGRPSPLINNALAWTPDGIFYSNRHGLRRWKHGRSVPVLRNCVAQAISGDGSWLYVQRDHDHHWELWRLHPDGTALQRLFQFGEPDGYLDTFQPSYDGSRLLSWVDSVAPRVVIHDATRAPVPTDPEVPISDVAAVTWN